MVAKLGVVPAKIRWIQQKIKNRVVAKTKTAEANFKDHGNKKLERFQQKDGSN